MEYYRSHAFTTTINPSNILCKKVKTETVHSLVCFKKICQFQHRRINPSWCHLLMRDARPTLSCGVRLSVTFRLSKRVNTSSNSFHRRLATPLVFHTIWHYSVRIVPNHSGRRMQVGYENIAIFDQKSHFVWKMIGIWLLSLLIWSSYISRPTCTHKNKN